MNLTEGRDATTAAEMFSSVDKFFIKRGISWDFVTALRVDNTNANIGEHNSLKSRALEKNHNIFIAGCPCHTLHNAACKFGSAFATVTGFDIEDHCVDLFYWFDKSSKRKSILKEYYEFCDSECEEFIKYVSTRWLFLERCVNRELKKYAGLKSYLLSEGLHDKRFKRLEESYKDPMTELYLLFFQSSIVTFTNFNKFLQREEPLIYSIYDHIQTPMNKLASKFIKPNVIQDLKNAKK